MTGDDLNSVLSRQLLLQLGERLKRLRLDQGVSAVNMAERLGITRNTLRAIEGGDSGPSIGKYVRVMSALGIGGELALLAGDSMRPAPAASAAARSRRPGHVVKVQVLTDGGRHQLQDVQSLILHEKAIDMVKGDPVLVTQAKETVRKWIATGDRRSVGLWREWEDVLREGTWRRVLGSSRRAQQLRQASPLVTVLPEPVRKAILDQVAALKKGVELSGALVPEGVSAAIHHDEP